MKKLLFVAGMCLLLLSCKLLGIKSKEHEMFTSLTWMDKTFTNKIDVYERGDTVGLLVGTKNFKKGKEVSINLSDDELLDDEGNPIVKKVWGIVDADGFIRIIVNTEKVFLEEE